MNNLPESKDCSVCGYRMETKTGSYPRQTIRDCDPYCANPKCKLFDKSMEIRY